MKELDDSVCRQCRKKVLQWVLKCHHNLYALLFQIKKKPIFFFYTWTCTCGMVVAQAALDRGN